MSITYNTWGANLFGVFRRTAAGVWSSNLVAATALDYFAGTPVVGDELYFCGTGGNDASLHRSFHNLRFFVGTALVATSITVVWEYSTWRVVDGWGWHPLTSVVDGTNAFRNTGQRDVTWTMPTDWQASWQNGIHSFWVRCRIVSIEGAASGGAQSTQAIQAGNNTILVTGTGHSFTSILNANNAGNWGVVHSPTPNAFSIFARLNIGDGTLTTVLSDTWKVVYLHRYVELRNNATLNLGTADAFWGRAGCHLVGMWGAFGWSEGWRALSGSTCNWFGTQLVCWTDTRASVSWFGGSTLNALDCLMRSTGTLEIYGHGTLRRCVLSGQGNFVRVISMTLTIIDCIVPTAEVGGNSPLTMTRMQWQGIHGNGFIGANWTLNAIDCAEPLAYSWEGHLSMFGVMRIRLLFTLVLTVQNAQHQPLAGATVTIRDAFNNVVFTGTTGANGQIETVLTRREVVMQTPAASWTPTITDFTPHTVVISAEGLATRTLQYTMNRRYEEIETMEPSVTAGMPKIASILGRTRL